MTRTFGKITAAVIVSLLAMQRGANAQQYELLESSNQALSIKICATCHCAELYASCAACHGTGGEGNELLGAPGLAGRDDWYMLRQLKLFKSGYRGSHPDDSGGAQMRAGMQVLQSDQDMNDVLAYINTLE